MQFPGLGEKQTGILVAISSLRSSLSRGIGEFRDLTCLAPWCRERGISLVQILPINDTGTQSSPYSALSAFALHPVYLAIGELPEYPEAGMPDIEELSITASLSGPVDFQATVVAKENILRDLYQQSRPSIRKDSVLARWIDANPWVKSYAVFRALRDENRGKQWSDWPRSQRAGTAELVDRLWADNEYLLTEPLFYAWMQYRAEQQLVEVSRALEAEGVYLKGDLPILMNEDSADVWANPQIFDRSLRAGAPPDMFSELGQNWDFPVYDWEYLERTDYSWWKNRLRQADKYYHAYRIDHVLGFFRIWSIPARNFSGTLGYFVPYRYLDRDLLLERGFDDGRIRWLAEPHVSQDELDQRFGSQADQVADAALDRIGTEDLFVFHPRIRGERDIEALPLTADQIAHLLEMYRDRAIIAVGEDRYFPAWTFRNCSRYQGLSDHDKKVFEDLVGESSDSSEDMWEARGRRLLSFMSDTADMLTCAEDLGVVPRSVPTVLTKLGILGLRIPRWTRHYDRPEEPFFRPQEYPDLTICATSVHDTSTFRGWWAEDADRDAFWDALGLTGDPPKEFDTDVATAVYTSLAEVASRILLFQIQDLFDLDPGLRSTEAASDRVNVPGTVAGSNWTYRWPVSVEDLHGRTAMNEGIDRIVEARTATG